MAEVATEDMELLKIEEEDYTDKIVNSENKISDDNLDDDEVPILKEKHGDDKSEVTKVIRMWHLEYYQEWFDMTTDLAVSRLKHALSPWKKEAFYSTTKDKPDLYCPFWITATLTFLIAAISNNARYYESSIRTKENWRSDAIELMTTSSTLSGFCLFVPLILYLLLLNSTNPKQYVEVLSVYGYSLLVYLPAVVLLWIPSYALRLIVFLLSAGFSASFLIRNLWLTSQTGWSSPMTGNVKIPCLVVILFSPILLSFVIKIYYFSF